VRCRRALAAFASPSVREFILLPYWLLFLFFALGALLTTAERAANAPPPYLGTAKTQFAGTRPLLVLGAILIALMIGFRYHVGADWNSYQFMYDTIRTQNLAGALKRGDPGYQVINWIAAQTGGQIWVVNLFCATIFSWGLFRFCQVQSSPWLSVAVAIPYMVIVVAMAYTRQAVAIGILLTGLAKQIRGASTLSFAAYTAAAALFHSTAVVVFPIVALAAPTNRLVAFMIAASLSLAFSDLIFGNRFDKFVDDYVRAGYSSQGAGIRVAMDVAAAMLLITFRGRLGFSGSEWKIWRNFSIATFIAALAFFIVPSSTAIDRVSLYLMPIQLAVFARIGAVGRKPVAAVSSILLCLAAVQAVWLMFAVHSQYWIPYRLYPIGDG
jgi:hypothetical protein